jgi:hypothetical protein
MLFSTLPLQAYTFDPGCKNVVYSQDVVRNASKMENIEENN